MTKNPRRHSGHATCGSCGAIYPRPHRLDCPRNVEIEISQLTRDENAALRAFLQLAREASRGWGVVDDRAYTLGFCAALRLTREPANLMTAVRGAPPIQTGEKR